ncbi:actin-related protein 2/3 complex subunit 1A-like [Pollicipes pollicipes]|uniref:LOW QUALITY PROTEIN: actin-related protein 2/3 complex subunit 1A-like n=1 Tax=Pollicipes pollicipes TaxID=41117 RepID=UPI00188578A4|nr:LOW QUALITY PROTEIN: actin-related protein 2/3 complex subunit 1A-like [Pollicipes pollicipes]XP_037077592.1 actin-related protein 2/3 complex subunit 1A-like [Pollicipes pollicipes]
MAVAEKHSFGLEPITTHAWNSTRDKVALSPNSKDVLIYGRTGTEWRQQAMLDQHDLRVTGIDWAPKSNRIVTCAADRNAYVWTQEAGGKWRPTLVLLRINRAATCVKWSPEENKFAVGSGARLISVCYFEQENDWWVSKHIKKPIRSTITSLDWHPNNVLLAAGSTDFKVRVFSAYIKDIEGKPSATCWGAKMPLGQLLAEVSASSAGGGGWVHDVQFSADGQLLAWCGHDASVSVMDGADANRVMTLRTDQLPYRSLSWVGPAALVAAGYSCCPMLYVIDGGAIRLAAKLDQSQKKEGGGVSAMRKFQSLDKQSRSEADDTALATLHQNSICTTRIVEGDRTAARRVSTSGADGLLVIWDVQPLQSSMAGLKIK